MNDFIKIMEKVWDGEQLPDPDLDAVSRWILSSEGREEFDSYLKGRREEYRNDRTIDCGETLRMIHLRKDSRAKAKRRRLIRRGGWVAASVILAVTGAYLFIPRSVDDATHAVYASSVPGGKMALLSLSDGRTIEVGDSEEWYTDGSGTTIKVGGGEVVYDKSSQAEQSAFHEIFIPTGGEYKLTLNDGSRVWLNSQTRLHYPMAFSDGERRVRLTGEAYFEVMPDNNRPFIVETEGQELTVLGTEFNISAYSDDPFVRTALAHGSVKIVTGHGAEVTLEPGKQAYLNKGTGEVRVHDADIEGILAWRDGFITIDDNTVEQVMRKLSRYYGVEYEISAKIPPSMVFRGIIPKYDIATTLEKLSMISNLKIRLDGNTVKVTE